MTDFTLGIYGIQDQGDFLSPRWTHDHSLALMEGTQVKWVVELERWTRRKHDNRLPIFIEDFMHELEIPQDTRLVCADSFAGRAFISRTGRWRLEGNHLPLTESLPIRAGYGHIDFKKRETWYVSHELAHIAANLPFCGGFEDDSLLVHLDGGASQSNASAFHYKGGNFRHIYHSWETAPVVLNFGFNDLTHAMLGLNTEQRMAGPGKLMGYASYGHATPELTAWLERHDWFRRHWENPEHFFESARNELGWHGEQVFNLHDPLFMDIAACCQQLLETTMLGLLARFAEETRARRLYLAGGVGLNIELTRKIICSGMFDEVYIPPCTSDCGLALGAAALSSFLRYGEVTQTSPFLGRLRWTPPTSVGIPFDPRKIADRLAAGQVVALCAGAAEVGPRALGHRSLLAAPDSIARRSHISETVKHREWYRPVAPVALFDLAEQMFPGSTTTPLSSFMLSNFPVAEGWRERIPGVVHVDGTARAQVVRRNDPEQTKLIALLEAVNQRYGLPCLINTSFNGPGEPIVQTSAEAIASAERLGVDVLILEDRMMCFSPAELTR